MNLRALTTGFGRPILRIIGPVLAGLLLCICLATGATPTNRSPSEISANADALMSQGRLDSARVILRAALASDSMNVDFWLQLARVEKKRGRASARSLALQQVFRLTPKTIAGRIELIPDLLALHKADSALVMARQALVFSRARDPICWYWMGRAYQQLARFDSAGVAFQQAYTLLGRGTF